MNQVLEPITNSRLDYMITTDNKIVIRYSTHLETMIIEVNKYFNLFKPTFKVFQQSYSEYIFNDEEPVYSSDVKLVPSDNVQQQVLQLTNYYDLLHIFSNDMQALNSILYVTTTFLQ